MSYLIRLIAVAALACSAHANAETLAAGKVVRLDPALDELIASDARIEKLADGFTWAEGPVWIGNGGYLLFTDVPENKMYRWSQTSGISVFLAPSGYDGPPLPGLREAGANGLHVESNDSILVADSGSRLVARLDLVGKRKTTIVSHYNGKRFNSPNDIARKRDGTIFFTDPPYGLQGGNDSPLKEMNFNGVYRIDAQGKLAVVDESLSFPNGVALSPDERSLYVANSDPRRPIWMRYVLDEQGQVLSKSVFADASDLVRAKALGLPDGIAVAASGHLFATGPGGVIVFTPDGKRLGRIETGSAIANCVFGDDGRTLFMTSHKMLARVRTVVAGSANER